MRIAGKSALLASISLLRERKRKITNLICLDFETFYSNEYTLKKLTTEEYVRDQRFEALVLGFVWLSEDRCPPLGSAKLGFLQPKHISIFLKNLPRPIGVIAHHAHFDGLILSHHYGFQPDYWFDTLSMARLLGGPTQLLSLEVLAQSLRNVDEKILLSPQCGGKLSKEEKFQHPDAEADFPLGRRQLGQRSDARGLESPPQASLAGQEGQEARKTIKTVPYQLFKGKRFCDLSKADLEAIGQGAVRDCELTLELFKRMVCQCPEVRLHAIDQTVRMFTEPSLRGDVEKLDSCAAAEHIRKAELLAALQTNATEIRSNPRFQALLEVEGVEIEYKLNPKGEQIPAFAKTDAFIQELLNDENERIKALAEARIATRSSIRETRAARLAGIARRGSMPVYLGAFGAANTLRWSAGDRTNWQNFPKEEADGSPSALSRAISAPRGYHLVIADKSQVECRILLSVAGQHDKLKLFEKGKDAYKELATLIYHRPIEEITDYQRFVGKTATLGCGYGMGGDKFARTCRSKGAVIDTREAENAVRVYRYANRRVCLLWRAADRLLPILANGGATSFNYFSIQGSKLYLPDDSYLCYDLEWNKQQQSWRRKTKGGAWRYIWGGGLVENLIQALSALDISETIQRIYNRTGERAVLLKHDEAVYSVNAEGAADFAEIVREEFSRPPAWLEYCPMSCEIAIRESLGK